MRLELETGLAWVGNANVNATLANYIGGNTSNVMVFNHTTDTGATPVPGRAEQAELQAELAMKLDERQQLDREISQLRAAVKARAGAD